MFLIPTDTAGRPFYSQTTTLDGTDYLLEFRFNSRELCWYLQVSNGGTVFAQGIKLVSNFRLIQKYSSASMPPGELVAVAPVTDDSPAGLNDLGIDLRVKLVYYTKAEMRAAGVDGWRL